MARKKNATKAKETLPVKSIEFERCYDCPYSLFTVAQDLIVKDKKEKWVEGSPVASCTNWQVHMPGNMRKGYYFPITERLVDGNGKKTYKGNFPDWCPLKFGVNKTLPGKFYGESRIAPPEFWITVAPPRAKPTNRPLTQEGKTLGQQVLV